MKKEIKIPSKDSYLILEYVDATLIERKLIDKYFELNEKGFVYKATELIDEFKLNLKGNKFHQHVWNMVNIFLDKGKCSQFCDDCEGRITIPIYRKELLKDVIMRNVDPRAHYSFEPKNWDERVRQSNHLVRMDYDYDLCDTCLGKKLLGIHLFNEQQWETQRKLDEEEERKREERRKITESNIRKHIPKIEYLSTGFTDLDRLLHGGLLKDSLHVVAGSSPADTYDILLAFTYNLVKQPIKVAYVPIFKGTDFVWRHLMQYAINGTPLDLQNGVGRSDSQRDSLKSLTDAVDDKRLQFLKPSRIDLPSFEKLVDSCLAQGISCIVLDAIQDVDLDYDDRPFVNNREQEFSKNLRRIADILQNKKISVIASSLVNRERENYRDYKINKVTFRKPMLKDLRDSNLLEHIACNVLYIDRTRTLDGNDFIAPQLYVLKNDYHRNRLDSIPVFYDEETGFYYEKRNYYDHGSPF